MGVEGTGRAELEGRAPAQRFWGVPPRPRASMLRGLSPQDPRCLEYFKIPSVISQKPEPSRPPQRCRQIHSQRDPSKTKLIFSKERVASPPGLAGSFLGRPHPQTPRPGSVGITSRLGETEAPQAPSSLRTRREGGREEPSLCSPGGSGLGAASMEAVCGEAAGPQQRRGGRSQGDTAAPPCIPSRASGNPGLVAEVTRGIAQNLPADPRTLWADPRGPRPHGPGAQLSPRT